MTRIFSDGFELGNFIQYVYAVNVGAQAVSSNDYGSGSFACKHGNNNVSGGLQMNFTAMSEGYFRFRFRSNTNDPINYFNIRNSGTSLVSIGLQIPTMSASYIGNLPFTFLNGVVYLIEMYYKMADSGGVITVKVDGIQLGTFSGDTNPGALTTFDNIFFKSYGGIYWIDDIAINNTSGAVDNSWCGDERYILLRPNANGDLSQLVGSDANSVDNYLHVDEFPMDSDTTYVQGTVVDEKDLYNLGVCGLPAGTVINRVWTEGTSKDTVAATGTVAHTIKTESTEFDSSNFSLLTSYTVLQKGSEYLVNPSTVTAWTITQLDALQVGPKTKG